MANLDPRPQQRAQLAAQLCTALTAAIPASVAELRGSLGSGTEDLYSDIDIGWLVPDGLLPTAVESAAKTVGSVWPVSSLRLDPGLARSARRRLIFFRLAGLPLFWRIDLDIRGVSVAADSKYDNANPAARSEAGWSRPASAIENAAAAIKAAARGQAAVADDLLSRGYQRIGADPAQADLPGRITRLADSCAALEPGLAAMATEVREIVTILVRAGLLPPEPPIARCLPLPPALLCGLAHRQTLSAAVGTAGSICGPAVFGADGRGRALARETRNAHEDIREIIREASLQPPGSPPWWRLARAALAAWAVQLDLEAHGPLAERRRRADPALRERLATRWRAFAEAHVRDQYPQAPPDIPTCQLRHDSDAPAAVPRLADPAFGPLACTCRACTRTLDRMIVSQRGYWRQRAVPAEDRDASGCQPSPHAQRPARPDSDMIRGTPAGVPGYGSGPGTARARIAAAAQAWLGGESVLAGWPVRRVWVLGWAATVIVAAIDAALGHRIILIGPLVLGPCCAALTGRWVPTALTGLWVIGLAFALCCPNGICGTAVFFAWLAVVAAAAVASTAAAAFFQARGFVRLR